jgi:hypothetical protein
VVEGTALEMRRRCKPTVGSNPTLSANPLHKVLIQGAFIAQPFLYPQRYPRSEENNGADGAPVAEVVSHHRRSKISTPTRAPEFSKTDTEVGPAFSISARYQTCKRYDQL